MPMPSTSCGIAVCECPPIVSSTPSAVAGFPKHLESFTVADATISSPIGGKLHGHKS
jgi:hypothetical protein